MVENGHAGSAEDIAEVGFSNPDVSRLGVEVVDYAELTGRMSDRTLAAAHRADFHQIFLITGGRAVVMVDFVDHLCEPGTLLHVAPGRVLRLPRAADPDRPMRALMVLFTPAFLPRLDAARAVLAPFGPAVRHPAPAERLRLARDIEELGAQYAATTGQADDPAGGAVAVELLRHLLAVLVLRIAGLAGPDPADRTDAAAGAEADDAFLRFRYELERSFATTRTASVYAARIGYSARSLNRFCLAATGRTAKQLVDARVALEAKRLLAHTDLPVAAVGRRLGFTEPTNFGKFFTRETGMPPGVFRADQRL